MRLRLRLGPAGFLALVLALGLARPAVRADETLDQTTRLTALARVWGLLKYFPPQVAQGTLDTQRVGIVPDMLVTPTIAGIQNGVDEVLERALGLLR